MKIGILTFTLNFNYGAGLQAFALSEFLKSEGHEVVILNIRRQNVEKWINSKLSCKRKIYNFGKNVAKHCLNYWKKDSFCQTENMLRDRLVFMDFFTQYTCHTRKYYTDEEIKEDLPIADLYIVGADQVWNPLNTDNRLFTYYCSFLPDNVKRISYAASFGGSKQLKLSQEQVVTIKSLLQKFSAISVREDIGIDILKETFGIDNGVEVLDPTFLPDVSVYEKIAKTSKIDGQGYIFSFKFNPNKEWYNSLKSISKQTGFKVRTDWAKSKYRGFYFNPVLPVQDWMQLIKSAEFIWTDSFHCMVFCILFHKNFVVTPSYKGGEGRILSLLKKIGLESRFIFKCEDVVSSRIWDERIDYSKVDEKLGVLRIKARGFLRGEL
ncbi:MAG: polysaccharide pyruvyl transferase family protein [Bacteroidales bacterium]|nr:polysaccharide pyruvyl transferase family protein [Bacteroidales bacterium]